MFSLVVPPGQSFSSLHWGASRWLELGNGQGGGLAVRTMDNLHHSRVSLHPLKITVKNRAATPLSFSIELGEGQGRSGIDLTEHFVEHLHRAQVALLPCSLVGRGEHGGGDFSAGMLPRLTCYVLLLLLSSPVLSSRYYCKKRRR